MVAPLWTEICSNINSGTVIQISKEQVCAFCCFRESVIGNVWNEQCKVSYIFIVQTIKIELAARRNVPITTKVKRLTGTALIWLIFPLRHLPYSPLTF